MEEIVSYIDSVFAISPKAYLLHALFIIALSVCAAYMVRIAMKLLEHYLESTSKALWDDVLVRSLNWPVVVYIVVMGCFKAAALSNFFKVETLDSAIPVGKKILALVAVTWCLISYVNNYAKAYVLSKKKKKEPIDVRTVDSITKIIKLIITLLVSVFAMDIAGLDMRAVVTFLGVGGVSLAFATKDLASSFFGTAVIYSDKPFIIGDLISIPSQNVEGFVEEIGWRVTKIRTIDRTAMYIPNSVFSNFIIDNLSRRTHRHINVTIPLKYTDAAKLTLITTKIERALRLNKQIDPSQPLFVKFTKFDNGFVELLVYAYSTCTDKALFYGVKQDVVLKIIDIIIKNGASLGYPTQVMIDHTINGERYENRG